MNSVSVHRKFLVAGAVVAGLIAGTGAASAQIVPAEIQAGINATTSAVISAVSRPTSPFVTGIAAEVEPNTCGAAPWARAQVGMVTAATAGTTVDVRYGGGLVAADYGCFNVNGSGLDITAGAEVGKLFAIASQPASPAMNATLDQTFVGGYVTAGKGPFSADVEVRREWNTFTAHGFSPAFIPEGTQFNVNRTIVNGAASYSIALGTDMALVPSIGGSVIHTDATSVTLPGGTAAILDDTGVVAFVGATIVKTIVLSDQASALQPFVTATYYHDFGTGLPATFTDLAGVVTTTELAGPGSYGEFSLGINYVKILEGNGPRQFSATLRGDAKFNGSFHGFNITAQARLQF